MAKLVYVAGPLFSEADREFLECMIDILAKASNLDCKNDFFLPHRDGGELGRGIKRKEIFELDIKQVNSARIIVALLDGQDVDSGTCIELGYGYAKGKKIFGLLTDFRAYCTADPEPHRPNLMVWGVCEEGHTVFSNLSSLAEAFTEYVKAHCS
ncbi:MAG: nucleoside 2-deoxyribosyltransferase [Dehalococcoidia bacterium]|nr:nucleoside 2-deoxyribosyltransferase [Dehalococcoidia bacterium]